MEAVRVDRFADGTRTGFLFLLAAVATTLAVSGCAGGPQCAPYARSLTGLALSGDAAAWWRQSDGRYAHADRPVPGAVLVFRPSRAMRDGHVAVVRRLVAAREIRVDHANWEPGRIDRDVPVIDVSADNDWSLVRVWWRPSRGIGRTAYPTFGFILPETAPSSETAMR